MGANLLDCVDWEFLLVVRSKIFGTGVDWTKVKILEPSHEKTWDLTDYCLHCKNTGTEPKRSGFI